MNPSRFHVDRVSGDDNDHNKVERIRVNSRDDLNPMEKMLRHRKNRLNSDCRIRISLVQKEDSEHMDANIVNIQ